MGAIQHRTVAVNGINIHVAEQGEGPIILLLHGFPELWYTWRHQIPVLASLGYRAVAPDLRGFGDSDAPPSSASYTSVNIVADLIGLLDSLGVDKVFVVGHDWGAVIAWYLCLYRPDRVKALVNMSAVFTPRNPNRKPTDTLRAIYGDDYYICRIQEEGEMESEFKKIGTRRVLNEILTYRTPEPLRFPKGKCFDRPSDSPVELPLWLTPEDIDYYASKFEKTGFTGGFNYYRALNLNWEVTAPWTGAQIKVPTKFIIGDLDLTYHAPGTKDYIHKGGMKRVVPHLEEVVVLEGVAHFLHEEKPQEITAHIHDFFKKF